MVSASGLVIIGLSVLGARRPDVGPVEVRVFHAVNGLPDWLCLPLWPPMQLGNLVVGTLGGVAVAIVDGEFAVASASSSPWC